MMAPLRRVLLDEKEIDYVSQRFNTKRGGEREREREKDVESKKLCTKREERETEDRKDMKERSGAARCRLASHC